MKSINIKNSLNSRLTIFSNVEEVKNWLISNKFSIEPAYMKMHIEKGIEYIQYELDKRTREINEIIENHKIRLSINYDVSNSYDKKELLSSIAKISLIGGVVCAAILGAGAFLIGSGLIQFVNLLY